MVGMTDGALPIEVANAPPSARFGRYIRTQKLGAGGMGEVWRAWDTGLNRWVALKFLKGGDAEEVARFKREAQTAAQLSHPSIAAVYEATDQYIAMHCVDGQTLGTLPRSDVRRLVDLVRQSAQAVHYAHERGVIHRDLKPANLMVDRDGRLFVMDFGLARQVRAERSLTVSGMMLGTPAYMSPEQAQACRADAASDVYSLGATLYDLLAGHPPFRDANMIDLLMKVVGEEAKPLRLVDTRIDRDLDTIVMKCLEKDPGRRYETAAALADDLGRWLAGEPVRARPVSWMQRAWRRARRNRALSAAVAGILVVAAVAGVVGVLQHRRAATELARTESLSTLWMEIVEKKRDLRSRKVSPRKAREALERAANELGAFVEANPAMAQGWYLKARANLYLERYEDAEADARKAIDLAADFHLARALLGMILIEKAQAASIASTSELGEIPRRQEALVLQAMREFAAWNAGAKDSRRLGLAPTAEDEIMGVLADVLSRHYAANDPNAVADLKRAADERKAEEYAVWIGLIGPREVEAEWYRRATEWAPGYTLAWLLAGFNRLRSGDSAGAIADFGEAIAVDPRNKLPYLIRGFARMSTGDFDGAIADCSEAILIDPRCKEAYQNRGGSLLSKGDYDNAMANFTTAISVDGRYANAHYGRGNARRAKGDFQGAISDYGEALAIDPRNTRALINRGIARSQMGDAAGAIEDYGEAIAVDPRCVEAHYNRGIVRDAKGDFDGAIRDYDNAIAIDRRHVQAHFNRGITRYRKGDLDGAIADHTQVISIDPRHAGAYARRGVMRHMKGDIDGAVADYREAISIDPRCADAHYNLGNARREKGDLDGAIEHYGKAIEADPRCAEAYCNRGFAHQVKRDKDRAIADFEKALDVAPADWPHRRQVSAALKSLRERKR